MSFAFPALAGRFLTTAPLRRWGQKKKKKETRSTLALASPLNTEQYKFPGSGTVSIPHHSLSAFLIKKTAPQINLLRRSMDFFSCLIIGSAQIKHPKPVPQRPVFQIGFRGVHFQNQKLKEMANLLVVSCSHATINILTFHLGRRRAGAAAPHQLW